MEVSFRSLRTAPKKWCVALCNRYNFREVVWLPGYESSNLGDILKANWYLNSGFRGDLPDNMVSLLDGIRADIPEEYKL
jgi:hypothetical protein